MDATRSFLYSLEDEKTYVKEVVFWWDFIKQNIETEIETKNEINNYLAGSYC